jgi:hypothetical protein
MSDKNTGSVHWSFWIIGIFMLVWNIAGCVNFFVQLDPDMVGAYRGSEQAIIVGRPAWATIAFAAAVFGGALGCILLLLRKSTAFYLFVFSLLGVVGTMAHAISADIAFGIGEVLGIIVMPLVVAAFLVWYSKYVESKGWINAT